MSKERNITFPAKLISTEMQWEDVVLNDVVLNQVEEIKTWLVHESRRKNDWQLTKWIKPGYRALFYGPAGTGKTLTATLLGKTMKRDVYKVDLSIIVSKHIGETEKNLTRLFDVAQHKDWILFFDEADALFGKPTAINSSNDRHANQQTAYLLQHIEYFPGIVILASNLNTTIDEAFSRRFQTMIHFTIPAPEGRLRLWKNAFSASCKLDPSIDLIQIAQDYELSGEAIVNIKRYCELLVVERNDTMVTKQELLTGIRYELEKKA